MSRFLISLAMPALNASAHIAEALDSVACQLDAGFDVEVVLADGGSTDATRDIAGRYRFVRQLEGRDNDIYEGFNRAIAGCQGDVIGFLNADDCLDPQALALVTACFADPEISFVSGGVSWGRDCQTRQGDAQRIGYHHAPLSVSGLLFGIPVINARFFRRKLVAKMGGLVPDTGLAADREFLLRVLKSGAKGHHVQNLLYHYRIHAGSATIAGDKAAQNRVWQAEQQLAHYLLSQPCDILTAPERKLAQRSHALAQFKQALSGSYRAGADHRKAYPVPLHHTLLQLPAALITWRKWRSKLSGY